MSQAAPTFAFRCTLDYPSLDAFVAGYGRNLSPRGIFLPSREPPEVGTIVRFEVALADGGVALRGDGVVAWREPLDVTHQEKLHGLAVRFLKLDSESRVVLERVAAHKAENPDRFYEAAPDLLDRKAPQPVAPAVEPDDVADTSPVELKDPTGSFSAVPAVAEEPPPAPATGETDELATLSQPKAAALDLSPREVAARLESLLSRRR